MMVPLGTGHMYARSWLMGGLIACAALYCWIQRFAGVDTGIWILGLMVFDAVGGFLAARRYNARRR
jgi:hypothetical protein